MSSYEGKSQTMTYGQHNPGPPEPIPGPGPSAPAGGGPAAALLAPAGPSSMRRTIVGAVAAVAALLLIVGSFLTWASASEEISEGPIAGNVSIAVSGMGSVDFEMNIADAPDGFDDMFNSDEGRAEAEDDTGMPGIWSVIFGVLVAAGAVLVLIRKFPGIGGVITAVGGLAATIAAIVFISDPIGAVTTRPIGDGAGDDFSAGLGLWLVLVGAIFALLAGAAMLALTFAPDKFDDAAPSAPAGFGGPGSAPFGSQPGPAQHQAGQYPGAPHQGPQNPGQQNPGQQNPGQQYQGPPAGQQYPGQHAPQQPGQYPGQPQYGQPQHGQPFPGQPGQYPGQPAPGQQYPGQSFPGQQQYPGQPGHGPQ